MKLYIQFITFVVSLVTFVVALFLTCTFAIDLILHTSIDKLTLPNALVNSTISFYLVVMAVAFILLSLLLIFIKKDPLKDTNTIKGENFTLVYYLAALLSLLFFLIYLVRVVSVSLESGTINVASFTKLGVIVIIFGPMVFLIKAILIKRKNFDLAVLLSWLFYLIALIAVPVFIFSKIGPPWIEKYILADAIQTNELRNLTDDIQSYVYQFGKLPTNLNTLSGIKNAKDQSKFDYSITGINKYKICTTFKIADSTGDFPHKAGIYCFDEIVSIPTPTPTPFVYISPYSPPAGPLTCKTLNTEMITDPKGFGYIGCDMEVTNGQIDLSRSYCEGQTTHQKEFLVPDAYGRRNRYWTTLTSLDPKEVVKVFAYSQSGEKIECFPALNQ